jgi:O-6-methylguanine DNA methyltransferase
MRSESSELSQLVYRLTSQIPRGKVSTYGALAKKLMQPKASRAIGMILSVNPHPIIVPCHRVVKSDGSLGGYTAPGGIKRKMELLNREGVEVRSGKVDLSRFLFTDFAL